jgi:hypothetical protein
MDVSRLLSISYSVIDPIVPRQGWEHSALPMTYRRVEEKTDALGRKVEHYSKDPAFPNLYFMPRIVTARKQTPKSGRAQRQQTKIFLFQSMPQSRSDDL